MPIHGAVTHSYIGRIPQSGKSLLSSVKLTYPDGRSEMLVSVPRYNYLWQTIYVQDKPIELPKGTRIDVSAHWDKQGSSTPAVTAPALPPLSRASERGGL